MDFDLDILIWLLIPLFGLLGRRKKKKPVPKQPALPRQEPILVEQPVHRTTSDDSFEEALRQIKEALGGRPQAILVDETADKKQIEAGKPFGAVKEMSQGAADFHGHAFPSESVVPLSATSNEAHFESFPVHTGDQFVSLRAPRKISGRKQKEPEKEPVLVARERKPESDELDWLDRSGHGTRTEDLRRAFVWREILGPPKSRRRR